MRYIEELMHINDQNCKKISQEILDDVNKMLEIMLKHQKNAENQSNHTSAAACTPFPKSTKTMSISCGFESMHAKFLKVQNHC